MGMEQGEMRHEEMMGGGGFGGFGGQGYERERGFGSGFEEQMWRQEERREERRDGW